MRINEIRKKEVNVTLNADELVMLGNLMYFYEKNKETIEPGKKPPNAAFHDLNASVIIARDLCQYGGLDSFSLKHIVRHEYAANPNSWLKQLGEILRHDDDTADMMKGEEQS